MASFWVYARGLWRRLEVPSGRVNGWAGRARFCFVRRGRLHLVRSAAALRGLQALQADQPTTVRDGVPLSQRRRVRAARALSPRCCCRHAADAHSGLVQLNVTAVQPSVPPVKADAAVQADAQSQSVVPPGRKRCRSPGPLPPAKLTRAEPHSEASETAAPPCKELIVNEEDVMALRRFLERDESGLFAVDLHRFDADDEYKSALFYKINPLVCAERDSRIADMLRKQHDEQALLRAFAGSLGLRAVSELRARTRYRMRPRTSSDKENRLTARAAADVSPNKSANRSRRSPRVLDSSTETSDSDSDSDFQTHSRVLRRKTRSHERNTRSTFAENRSKSEKSKEQRDDDVRSKYLVTPRQQARDDSDNDGSTNDDRSTRSRKNNNASNDRPKHRVLTVAKGKETNDTQSEINHKPRERYRNARIGTPSKQSKDVSRDRSRSNDNDPRKSLRSRGESSSPSIISKKIKTQRAPANDSSRNSDSTYVRDRNGRFTNRGRRLLGNSRSGIARIKDPKDSSSKTVDDSKDGKRNDARSKDDDLPLSVHSSKYRRFNGESSKDISSSKSIASKDQRKDEVSRSSKTKTKTKELENSDASEKVWAARNGSARDESDGGSQSRDEQTKDGEIGHADKRPRRSTANTDSVFPAQRREYSSLEDHAIVQWLSLGSRARRVNGNAVWRELQEQFARLAGRARSWHSLRNRYLRSILPALGALALPPARVSALRAAQARGEIKSRRRAPAPNPLLSLPAVRSAWGARPRPRLDTQDTQDTLVPATSESEATQRTLRSSAGRAPSPRKHSPRKHTPHSSKKVNASSRRDQPSPTYSEVTRRFGATHTSTPELRPRDAAASGTGPHDTAPRDTSPHKKTRKLFNPKTAM